MVNVQYPEEFDTMLGPSTDCEYRRYPGASVTCALLDVHLETPCSCEECPLRELVAVPYCCECGHVRPEHSKAKVCVPCGNRGHSNSLIMDDNARIVRIQMAYKFYDHHGYTNRDTIPGWQRKIHPPLAARKMPRWVGDDLQERLDDIYAYRTEAQA